VNFNYRKFVKKLLLKNHLDLWRVSIIYF